MATTESDFVLSYVSLLDLLDQRGVRCADAGLCASIEAGHVQAERQRRCHCAGPSLGGVRSTHHRPLGARAEAQEPKASCRIRVHWRWPRNRPAH